MLFIGLLLFVQRPFARVLDALRRGQDHDVLQATQARTLDHHPRQAHIHRPAHQLAAHLGNRARTVQRTEFSEQVVGIVDHSRRGRINKGKVLDLAQAHAQHLQNDRGQRSAQDFRLGEFRPAVEIFLAVEPYAGAGAEATAAPGALVGAGLRNGLDGQALDAAAV